MQQEQLKKEKYDKIIGRYHSISLGTTLEVPNVKRIIIASWFIYLEY